MAEYTSSNNINSLDIPDRYDYNFIKSVSNDYFGGNIGQAIAYLSMRNTVKRYPHLYQGISHEDIESMARTIRDENEFNSLSTAGAFDNNPPLQDTSQAKLLSKIQDTKKQAAIAITEEDKKQKERAEQERAASQEAIAGQAETNRAKALGKQTYSNPQIYTAPRQELSGISGTFGPAGSSYTPFGGEFGTARQEALRQSTTPVYSAESMQSRTPAIKSPDMNSATDKLVRNRAEAITGDYTGSASSYRRSYANYK